MKLIGGLSSLFIRQCNLFKVINSMSPQLDILYVYLDYNDNEDINKDNIPNNVIINHRKNYNISGARCKFLFIEECYKNYNDDFIYFSLDDDIKYPNNYISTTVNKINNYNNKAVISYHGGILPKSVTNYSKQKHLIHFRDYTPNDKLINLCGTGVTAFHASTIRLSFNIFKEPNRDDIYFSAHCQNNNIPIICGSKNKEWLSILPQYGTSLWDSEKANSTVSTNLVNKLVEKWQVIKIE